MLTKSLKWFGLIGRVEPESAHDGDQSRRPCNPKCGDSYISLLPDSLFRHYNRMILRRRGKTGGTIRSHLIYAAETWEPDHRSE